MVHCPTLVGYQLRSDPYVGLPSTSRELVTRLYVCRLSTTRTADDVVIARRHRRDGQSHVPIEDVEARSEYSVYRSGLTREGDGT